MRASSSAIAQPRCAITSRFSAKKVLGGGKPAGGSGGSSPKFQVRQVDKSCHVSYQVSQQLPIPSFTSRPDGVVLGQGGDQREVILRQRWSVETEVRVSVDDISGEIV